MARVTIEDCIEKIPSRFELVVLAGQRAKELASGAKPLLERDNDKDPVLALREVAADMVTPSALREALIKKYQRLQNSDDQDKPDDNEDSSEIKKDLSQMTYSKEDLEDMSDLYEDEAEGEE